MSDVTCAVVEIEVANNATFLDAWQFGDADDFTWDLVGQNFKLEVKASRDDVSALLSLSSVDGTLVVDDTTARIIHANLDDNDLRAALPVGEYVYDLIMYDGSAPPVRIRLMRGKFKVRQGVTGEE